MTLQCPNCGGVFLTLQQSAGGAEICPHCSMSLPRHKYRMLQAVSGQGGRSALPPKRSGPPAQTPPQAAPPAVAAPFAVAAAYAPAVASPFSAPALAAPNGAVAHAPPPSGLPAPRAAGQAPLYQPPQAPVDRIASTPSPGLPSSPTGWSPPAYQSEGGGSTPFSLAALVKTAVQPEPEPAAAAPTSAVPPPFAAHPASAQNGGPMPEWARAAIQAAASPPPAPVPGPQVPVSQRSMSQPPAPAAPVAEAPRGPAPDSPAGIWESAVVNHRPIAAPASPPSPIAPERPLPSNVLVGFHEVAALPAPLPAFEEPSPPVQDPALVDNQSASIWGGPPVPVTSPAVPPPAMPEVAAVPVPLPQAPIVVAPPPPEGPVQPVIPSARPAGTVLPTARTLPLAPTPFNLSSLATVQGESLPPPQIGFPQGGESSTPPPPDLPLAGPAPLPSPFGPAAVPAGTFAAPSYAPAASPAPPHGSSGHQGLPRVGLPASSSLPGSRPSSLPPTRKSGSPIDVSSRVVAPHLPPAPPRRFPWFATLVLGSLAVGGGLHLLKQQMLTSQELADPGPGPVTPVALVSNSKAEEPIRPVSPPPAMSGPLDAAEPPVPPVNPPEEMRRALPADVNTLSITSQDDLQAVAAKLMFGIDTATSTDSRLKWIADAEQHREAVERLFASRGGKLNTGVVEPYPGPFYALPSGEEVPLFKVVAPSAKNGALVRVHQQQGRQVIDWPLFAQTFDHTFDRFVTTNRALPGRSQWFTVLARLADEPRGHSAGSGAMLRLVLQGSLASTGSTEAWVTLDSPSGEYFSGQMVAGRAYLVEVQLGVSPTGGRRLMVLDSLAARGVASGQANANK